jgi:hypothetical protein
VDGGAEGGGGGFVTLLTLEADSEARASWARDVANALKVMTSEAATQVKAHLLAPIVNSRWVCVYILYRCILYMLYRCMLYILHRWALESFFLWSGWDSRLE